MPNSDIKLDLIYFTIAIDPLPAIESRIIKIFFNYCLVVYYIHRTLGVQKLWLSVDNYSRRSGVSGRIERTNRCLVLLDLEGTYRAQAAVNIMPTAGYRQRRGYVNDFAQVASCQLFKFDLFRSIENTFDISGSDIYLLIDVFRMIFKVNLNN